MPVKMPIFAVLGAMTLVVLDGTIVNIALPTIANTLQVTASQSVLIATAYQVAVAMMLLPCAALGESVGFRGVFTGGVAIFAAASAICALSPDLPCLIVARFLQGMGGAAILSLGVALLRQVVPQSRLGAAIGWNALTVALSSAAGPTVGAIILSVSSWQWLFAVNLPLGSLVLLASRALPNIAGTGARLDLASAALNVLVFGLFVSGAEFLSMDTALAAALFGGAALALCVLIRRELPQKAPLIPIDLLRSASFRTSVIASVFCFTGQTASLIALPFYLQHDLQQTALMTGLLLTPWPLTVALTAPMAGSLADRLPGAWLCAAGCGFLAAGLVAVALWPAAGNTAGLIPFFMLCGFGFGLFQVANNRNMFLSAPKARSGAAGGLQGTARLTGQTLGAVMLTLLFASLTPDDVPYVALIAGAVLTFVAGIVSGGLLLPGAPRAALISQSLGR